MNDFDKLTKSPNLKGGRVVNICAQRFQMALLLFKENTCAKLC